MRILMMGICDVPARCRQKGICNYNFSFPKMEKDSQVYFNLLMYYTNYLCYHGRWDNEVGH